MSKMTFEEACGMIYGKGLSPYVELEKTEKEFLPQKAFKLCRARGKALSYGAEKRVDDFKGLCIALHREKDHDEDVSEEVQALYIEMPEEDIELAVEGVTTYGWWRY